MKKRTKLTALIASFCLMIAIFAVGVFALTSATVPMGGQINFKADGINATISQGTLTGGKLGKTETGTELWENVATSGKLQEIVYSTTQSKVKDNSSTWDGLYLHYDEGQTVMTIAFTIKNDGTKPLYVDITTPTVPTGMTIVPMSDLGTETLTTEIAAGDTANYYVVFTVTNETYDISNAPFKVEIELSNTKLDIETLTVTPTGGVYNNMKFEVITGTENEVSVVADDQEISGDVIIPGYVVMGGKTYVVTTIKATGSLLPEPELPDDLLYGYSKGLVTSKYVDYYPRDPSEWRPGYGAFYNCTGITSIVIPNTVKTIECYAFANCTSLKSIYIPSSVETISAHSEDLFYGCREDCVIYCENEKAVNVNWNDHTGWFEFWDSCATGGKSKPLEKKFGYTLKQYLSENNLAYPK